MTSPHTFVDGVLFGWAKTGQASVASARAATVCRRENTTKGLALPGAAENAAEHPAQDLAADLAADRARGLLGHRLDHSLAALGTEEDLAHLLANAGALLFRRRLPLAARCGWRLTAARLPGRCVGSSAPLAQDLVGGLPIHRLVVLGADRAPPAHGRPLLGGDGAHPAAWRADDGLLHRHRHTLVLKRRDQRLADPEPADDRGDVELRVGHEGLGSRAHRPLVARGEGAERVLDAVAELAQDLVRHVVRKL